MPSLSSITLQDFRSYQQQTITFNGDSTAIIGANASGKTTIMEAVRLLSVGKSFRSARPDELIRFDRPFFHLQAEWFAQAADFFYGVQFAENPVKERVIRVNGQVEPYMDYVGRFPTVLFIPENLEIALGPPSERRKYLDSILWQIDREFRQSHIELQRILKERSALLYLVRSRRAGIDELEPWNVLLGQATARIRAGRQRFIEFFADQVATNKDLKNTRIEAEIQSKPAFTEDDSLLASEIEAAQNLYGCHRDEVEIIANGRSARRFASRGQARSVVALLKAVEAEFLREQSQNPPVILLDDILSELDEQNGNFAFAVFEGRYQVIATSITKNKRFKDWQVVELGSRQ